MPGWLVEILERQIVRVQAESLETAIMASAYPYLKDWDRRRLSSQLSRILNIKPILKVEVIDHDPARAAEWFKSRGYKVINGDSGNRDSKD